MKGVFCCHAWSWVSCQWRSGLMYLVEKMIIIMMMISLTHNSNNYMDIAALVLIGTQFMMTSLKRKGMCPRIHNTIWIQVGINKRRDIPLSYPIDIPSRVRSLLSHIRLRKTIPQISIPIRRHVFPLIVLSPPHQSAIFSLSPNLQTRSPGAGGTYLPSRIQQHIKEVQSRPRPHHNGTIRSAYLEP